MVESLHAQQRAQAAKKQREANIYGLAFLLLFFVAVFVPAPSWVHWIAFFVGIVAGALAYDCWGKAQTLRYLARMGPPPD
jgi:protein-S-isoprenylcysteine O-methyltransferase Ste14